VNTLLENPSVVERQAREIRALKARINDLEGNYQHEGQMRVEADRLVRLLAVAHAKRQLMPAAEAEAIARMSGDPRFLANAKLWESAMAWLDAAVGPDYADHERRRVEKFEKDLLSREGFFENNTRDILKHHTEYIRSGAIERWEEEQRELRTPKIVPLVKDEQVDDLRHRIAALSRDVAAHQKRFGKDPQVVAWLREIAPAPTEPTPAA
jgi:hypothetical protein